MLVLKNREGMDVLVTHAAFTDPYGESTLWFLSMTGIQVAVEAIKASIHNGTRLSFACDINKSVSAQKDIRWITQKMVDSETKFRCYRMIPDTTDQDFVLLPFYTVKDGKVVYEPDAEQWSKCSPAHLLVEYLKRYSLWPVHSSWADALWEAEAPCEGYRAYARKIQPLRTYSDPAATPLPWAYWVRSDGWDQTIDVLLKNKRICVPEEA